MDAEADRTAWERMSKAWMERSRPGKQELSRPGGLRVWRTRSGVR